MYGEKTSFLSGEEKKSKQNKLKCYLKILGRGSAFYLLIFAFTGAYRLGAYIYLFWKTAKRVSSPDSLSVIQIFKPVYLSMSHKPPTKPGLDSISTRRKLFLVFIWVSKKMAIGF